MHDVIEIEKRYRKARDLVGKLASGEEEWHMRIPVDRELDTDMVLAASLDDIPKLIEMLFEARARGQGQVAMPPDPPGLPIPGIL